MVKIFLSRKIPTDWVTKSIALGVLHSFLCTWTSGTKSLTHTRKRKALVKYPIFYMYTALLIRHFYEQVVILILSGLF